MLEKKIKIAQSAEHEFELATMVVQAASQHRSVIHIAMGDKKVNAKSIMGMTYLTLMDGDEVTVTCEGEDEEKAMETMTAALQK